jgi:hypothetical protein
VLRTSTARDVEWAAIHDFGVAVEVPLEQRTDVVASVRDKAVDGHDRTHHNGAHASIMPAQHATFSGAFCPGVGAATSVCLATPTQVGY